MKAEYTVPELTSEERHEIYRNAQLESLKNPQKPFANYINATIIHVLDKQIFQDVMLAFADADCRRTKFNPKNLEPGDFLALVEVIPVDPNDPEEGEDEEYIWYMYLGGDMFYDGHGCIDLKTLLEMAEAFGYPVRQLEAVS